MESRNLPLIFGAADRCQQPQASEGVLCCFAANHNQVNHCRQEP